MEVKKMVWECMQFILSDGDEYEYFCSKICEDYWEIKFREDGFVGCPSILYRVLSGIERIPDSDYIYVCVNREVLREVLSKLNK